MTKWLVVLLLFVQMQLFAQIGPIPGAGAKPGVDTWNEEQVYLLGQVVLRQGVVYQSLANNNVEFDPAGTASMWTTIIGGSGSSITLTTTGTGAATLVGTVLNVPTPTVGVTTSSPLSGTTALSCPTCGVTGSPLSQFAATTSAQLAGVLSDETGSGAAVFATGAAINPASIGATTPGTAAFTSLSNTLMQNSAVSTVASNTTIAPTSPMVIISGTTAIATVTLPSGFTSGCFDSLATGAWTTTTAGNIFAVMTATANTPYRWCFFTTSNKWFVK